jgi:multidrug efflux pump subunit AcrA (membrane-fusion protein)
MTTKLIPWIALALIVGGCQSPPITTKVAGQIETAQFTTDVVKRQNLTGYSFFDGKLVIPESAQASAFSPYDTPVLAVMTGAGKQVGRGEPIVKLTIPGADAAASAAKANENSAQANYSAQKGDSSDPVREAQRALALAQAEEKAARATVANGGQADVESATQARVLAQDALRQAQQDLRQSLQPAKEAVGQASATLKAAKADAARGIVRAPISGTVISLEAQPGMMARSSQALATIINFDAVRVQGQVPPELKDLVVKNSRVIIAMSGASSDPLDGSVIDVTVAPPDKGQKSPGYLAVIKFLNPRAMVQPSITVERIGVKTGTANDVLVVPVGAINTKNGKSTVNVQSGNNWIETPVVIGISDGALTEIKSGLTEGAVVRVLSRPQDVKKM